MTSIALFGAGRIGGAVANLLAVRNLAQKIVLYDHSPELLKAQMLDILHTGREISISTDPGDISSCDILVCTAGQPRNPTISTRTDLLHTNIPAARECARFLERFTGIVIVVTNPMDIITYYLQLVTGISKKRIIGFGGQLDSARFSYTLKTRGISEDGWIIGEHGEHQVPLFSRMNTEVSKRDREEILHSLRGASMEIIRGKGATEYGPAWHISELIRTIISDSREIIPCSCILEGEYGISGCALGVPAVIGKEGIIRIGEWNLDSWEVEHMQKAAEFETDICKNLTEHL
jgi:malate dehydrogenase